MEFTIFSMLFDKNDIIQHTPKYIEQSKLIDSPDKLDFKKPNLDVKNEVESLSNTIAYMAKNMKDNFLQVISAEKETAHMKEIANTDPLTGVKN